MGGEEFWGFWYDFHCTYFRRRPSACSIAWIDFDCRSNSNDGDDGRKEKGAPVYVDDTRELTDGALRITKNMKACAMTP